MRARTYSPEQRKRLLAIALQFHVSFRTAVEYAKAAYSRGMLNPDEVAWWWRTPEAEWARVPAPSPVPEWSPESLALPTIHFTRHPEPQPASR